MPSFPLSQFSDLEEMMMCKQLLNLDLREQNSRPPPPALGQGMRSSPGLIGQPHSNSSTSFSLSSLSCLPGPDTTSDGVLLTANQWGQGQQQPESPLPSQSHQLAHPTQWAKTGFLAQRSLSMVETTSSSSGISTSLASLGGWPGAADLTQSQSDISSPSTRYKTELCRSFTESGLCKYGGKCQFAHGQDELRDLNRHPKYKTEPCRTFHTVGFCPYGIRCHFVHNNEEEHLQGYSRSSSSSSSSSGISYHHHQQQQPPLSSSSRLHRPPLVRQSFSFAGFPSAPQLALQPALLSPHPPPHAAFSLAASPASPPSCADITDLLSHAFLEMDSAFEASPAHSLYQQQQPPLGQVAAEAEAAELADPRSPFLPSPDSGCSPSGLSPSASPSLRQSPGVTALGVFSSSEPMGTRSLSYTSLSDQDQDGSSSASSLSGSESCGGLSDANGRRLAVFSQLSVPEDATGLCL